MSYFSVGGKMSILIDGGFGSTGKGLFAGWVAKHHKFDWAVTSASSNAGHTYIDNNTKVVARHLPIYGILNKRSMIGVCAGSIIDPEVMLREIRDNKVEDRIVIHPRAAIIEDVDKEIENNKNSMTTKSGSTQKGVGAALARKVLRENPLAVGYSEFKDYISDFDLESVMDGGSSVFMEMPQGIDLSINSGLEYPYVTSREISVSQALSDAMVHPHYLGPVAVTFRTFPIRVGNIKDKNGKEIGYSGPFWADSKETTWEELGLKPEITTVTGRVRRVAEFSISQFMVNVYRTRPSVIFINFMNYIEETNREWFIGEIKKALSQAKIDAKLFVGYGPEVKDIVEL